MVGSSLAQKLAKKFSVTVVDKKALHQKLPSHIKHINMDILQNNNLFHIVTTEKPNIVINSVNIATLFSHEPEKNFKNLIKFYHTLYQTLNSVPSVSKYIQMGTTGSGGLGFNIPFTHGDKLDDLPIINKAAFAGVSTAMLTLLSRSYDSRVAVAEIKPGLAIFKDLVEHTNFHGSKLVVIDGGESGYYTYNELALLTRFMGFTVVDTITNKAIEVIEDKKNWHRHCVSDTIESLNESIIRQTRSDKRKLNKILRQMKKLSGENYIIATGKLGPPSITRDLILSCIKHKYKNISATEFSNLLATDQIVLHTLDYISQEDPSLHRFLVEELVYKNYKELTCTANEPWENVKQMLINYG